jgi:hypothetical protein
MFDQFTAVAAARAERLQQKIEGLANQASIRYVFNPIFDMIISSLQTTVPKGRITPISEQGQPVGEVYLMTLVRDGEMLDPALYNIKNGVGEIPINPAPLVDDLVNQYGPQGACQIKSLFNLDIEAFCDYELNELIFDGRTYETAEAYMDRFQFVREKTPDVSFAPLLGRVLAELEASVSTALAWSKAKAEEANQMLKNGDLKKFSPFERTLFKFSGITPIDEAMNQVATDQAALANSMPEVIRGLEKTIAESKPDWQTVGEGIAAGIERGMEKIAGIFRQPAAEEAPAQPAPKKSEKKS